MTRVRLATSDDVDAVVEMVALAFGSDPGWLYFFGQGNSDARRAFARTLLEPRVARGTAWVTDDCTALAMWDRRSPDDVVDPAYAQRWQDFRAQVGENVWSRVDAYDNALEAAAPPAPYWYLGVLATHPDAQGQGHASAVLQPGFEAAAADGWDCWLETSSPQNKAFYARRGFTEPRELDLPGGPPTWWLGRTHPVG